MSEHHEPVLTVDSGDAITVETLDCFSNALQSETDLFSSVGWDQVNPATGPISIKGASPGDTLRVDVLDIVVEDEGTVATHPDFGALRVPWKNVPGKSQLSMVTLDSTRTIRFVLCP